MSGIGRIGPTGASGAAGVGRTRGPEGLSPGQAGQTTPIPFHESFVMPQWEDLPLQEREAQWEVAVEDRPYRDAVVRLFTRILLEDIDIIPKPPQKNLKSSGVTVEASFVPISQLPPNPRHQIRLPLRGLGDNPKPISIQDLASHSNEKAKRFVTKYVDKILEASYDEDITRLLVVTAHEFGHYLSYREGNHTTVLREGLRMAHSRNFGEGEIEHYTWLVFREEVTAWRHATQVLEQLRFEDWPMYDFVKTQSLKAYCDSLQLEKANLNTWYKLSFLGEDMSKICKPVKPLDEMKSGG